MSKKKNPTGRPRTKIDWSKVDNLLKAGVEGTSIAQMLGISADTLYLRCTQEYPDYPTFTAYAQAKRAEGLDLLKLKQFDVALKGDRTMLIWLGKQYLGQSDKVDGTLDAKVAIEQITGITVK